MKWWAGQNIRNMMATSVDLIRQIPKKNIGEFVRIKKMAMQQIICTREDAGQQWEMHGSYSYVWTICYCTRKGSDEAKAHTQHAYQSMRSIGRRIEEFKRGRWESLWEAVQDHEDNMQGKVKVPNMDALISRVQPLTQKF